MIEAKERGQAIPQDLLAGLSQWLAQFAATPAGTLADARLRAYAVYLPVRQGQRPNAALSNVEQELAQRHSGTWPTDLAAAYLASAYRLMQRTADADRIVERVAWSVQKRDFGDKAVFLSVHGKGEPGGPAFQQAIEKVYSLAYTVKFMLKNRGKLDFSVSRLECLWHMQDPENTPRSEWTWQVLVRIPAAVSATDLEKAGAEIRERKQLDTSSVERINWKEGRCVQLMHVGPYDQVGGSYQLLDAYAAAKGLQAACPAHEIYISDPRRVAPARLKTIVRLPVKP